MRIRKMMRQLFVTLLVVALLVSALPLNVLAANETTNTAAYTTAYATGQLDDLLYSINDGQVIITGYEGSNKGVIIPNTIEDLPVTAIGKDAFKDCTYLSEITLPNTLVSIGWSAFSGCVSLESINIPNNVTSIESYAFSNCTSLTNLIIPNSMSRISYSTFQYCSGLTSVTIPDTVTLIGTDAFKECNGILAVYYSSSYSYRQENLVIQSGNYCLQGWRYADDEGNLIYSYDDTTFTATVVNCDPFIATANIPSTVSKGDKTYSVTSIGKEAFFRCENLTNVLIPNSVTSINEAAFAACTSLNEIIIPSSVTSIGYHAFASCNNLICVTISDSVLEMNQSFANCTVEKLIIGAGSQKVTSTIVVCKDYLKEVVLPNSVTQIDSYAFYGYTALINIVIPDSVTSIGTNAFIGCSKLANVYYDGTAAAKSLIDISSGNTYLENATWYFDCCVGADKHQYDDCYDIVCDVCGKLREVTHDFVWTIDSSPTCGKAGIKHEECTLCHAKINENTPIDATGNHSYDNGCDDVCNVCTQARIAPHYYEWVIDKNGNCGVSGIKHEECIICHAKRNENTSISATGNHIFTNSEDTKCDICEQGFFLIKFNSNGGTSVSQIRALPNQAIILPTNIPEKNGYNFVGWAVSKNEIAQYQPGDSYYVNKEIVLYAQWNKHCVSCSGTGTLKCSTCSGKGTVFSHREICTGCNGGSYICGRCGAWWTYSTEIPAWCPLCRMGGLWYACGMCNGSGGKNIYESCDDCNGSGKEKCTNCGGTGETKRESVSTPGMPVLKSVNATTIVLQAIENGEYSLDGITWQDRPIFENLQSGKYYTLYQRHSKTDTTWASASSEALEIVAHDHTYDNAADTSCNLCENIRILDNIAIFAEPDKLTYLEEKDALDVTGGKITLYYLDGTEGTIDMNTDMIFGFDNTKVGSQELIVTYGDCTTSFEIEILAKVLVDIKVTQLPSKTEYLESKEVLDLSGGKLTLYYSNDTSQQIDLSEATVSGFDNSIVGSKSIVVVYNELTTTFSVDVVAKTLVYIEVTTKPNKLTYLEGDAFDKAGMVVTAYYNNDTSTMATNYSVNGYTSTPGTKTITVSYNGKSASFTVVVEAKTLSSISVTTKPQKMIYVESTLLDDTGMILTLYYNNNTSETITTGWTSEYDFSTVGISTVQVTYGGKSCAYDVMVIAKTLTSISIESEPIKHEYLEGAASLDTDGLEIRAYYDNNTSEVISGNYTVTGYDSTPGTKTITVTYGGKTATFIVEVAAKSVMSIAVTKKPNKLTYLEGDSFDKTGLVVTAYYDNDTSSTIADYTITGYTSTVGTKTITVSYNGKTATFTVTVNSRVPSSVTSSKHTVSGNCISKITAGTTVTSLLNGLNEGSYCKVYKGSSVVSGNTVVGTGMTVKIMDGNTAKATYTIIVTGDTNGDGNITVTDMIAIKAHILKKSTLSGAYATAADTNGDNGISITDFIQVKAKILGKGTITAR